MALLGEGQEITEDELSEDFLEQAGCGLKCGKVYESPAGGKSGDALLADVEASCISATLDRTGGNIAAAARMMGIGRNTLYRKLRRLNVPDFKEHDAYVA